MIYHGDSLEILKTLDANSVDAVVTDRRRIEHYGGQA